MLVTVLVPIDLIYSYIYYMSPLVTAVLAHTFIYIYTHIYLIPTPAVYPLESRCTRNLKGTRTFHILFTPVTVYITQINHTDTLLLVWSFIFSSFCHVYVGSSQTSMLCWPKENMNSAVKQFFFYSLVNKLCMHRLILSTRRRGDRYI